jgi:hypothetical protein
MPPQYTVNRIVFKQLIDLDSTNLRMKNALKTKKNDCLTTVKEKLYYVIGG